jgi:hypothetical protein
MAFVLVPIAPFAHEAEVSRRSAHDTERAHMTLPRFLHGKYVHYSSGLRLFRSFQTFTPANAVLADSSRS